MNQDFTEFQSKIRDLDRRMATILCQGFGDCNSLGAAVKVRSAHGETHGWGWAPGAAGTQTRSGAVGAG